MLAVWPPSQKYLKIFLGKNHNFRHLKAAKEKTVKFSMGYFLQVSRLDGQAKNVHHFFIQRFRPEIATKKHNYQE